MEASTPTSSAPAVLPESLREDFPILHQTIYRQRPLVYLDNAASTQRPTAVLDAMDHCYRETYANVHRGIHWLSEQASAQFEQARLTVQSFINARHGNEVIFTAGTTAAINTVARSWGDANLQAGDEILLPIFEHHSNIVPWQQVAVRTGARVVFVGVDQHGNLDREDLLQRLTSRTKIFAFAAVSNVLGCHLPVAELVQLARKHGALTLVDAAQHTPHSVTDVQAWDADFVAFSAHKLVGPTGIGVLYGKQELLESMPPFLGGGSMIDQVTTDGFTPGELPAKFEAGTPPIVEAIGLAAAIEYLQRVGLTAIEQHEAALVARAYEKMHSIDGLKILGPPAKSRAGLISFVVDGVSAQDLSILLDQKGFAIRAGHHCAMPLHQHYGLKFSCRASFYLYNTLEEVDRFAETLNQVVSRLHGL